MLGQCVILLMLCIFIDHLHNDHFLGADGLAGRKNRPMLKEKSDVTDHQQHTQYLVEMHDPDFNIKVFNLRKAYDSV